MAHAVCAWAACPESAKHRGGCRKVSAAVRPGLRFCAEERGPGRFTYAVLLPLSRPGANDLGLSFVAPAYVPRKSAREPAYDTSFKSYPLT